MAEFFAFTSDPTAWVALATLIAMELVLGIDNLIFISILTNKLPAESRERARRIGIGLALVLRLGLLSLVFVIVRLTEPVIEVLGKTFSWRDIILIAGGLFLVWKATREIHPHGRPARGRGGRGQPGRDDDVRRGDRPDPAARPRLPPSIPSSRRWG